jgi:hypothetical protein
MVRPRSCQHKLKPLAPMGGGSTPDILGCATGVRPKDAGMSVMSMKKKSGTPCITREGNCPDATRANPSVELRG